MEAHEHETHKRALKVKLLFINFFLSSTIPHARMKAKAADNNSIAYI